MNTTILKFIVWATFISFHLKLFCNAFMKSSGGHNKDEMGQFQLEHAGTEYSFKMESNPAELFDKNFDLFHSHYGERFVFDESYHKFLTNECKVYTGSDFANEATISIHRCGESYDGMVIKNDGKTFLITSSTDDEKKNITKRSLGPIFERRHVIVEDDLPKKTIENILPRIQLYKNISDLPIVEEKAMPVLQGPIIVELAVFADQELWKKFKRKYNSEYVAENELKKFIFTLITNVNLIYGQKSMDPSVVFRIKRFELMKNPPSSLQSSAHDTGDVDKLLTNFCKYQQRLNPRSRDDRHWDHAVLLSGYDLHFAENYMAAGYAPVKGMCSDDYSCTIVEGYDFSATFTLAHEMGHSLGMLHDGQNNDCSAQCCLMSYISGGGKTVWSSCSVREMNAFVNQLGRNSGYPKNCLTSGRRKISAQEDANVGWHVLPGQRYTADQQCKLTHGKCYDMELKDGAKIHSVCAMLYCGSDDGFIYSAQPALEGTYCGANRWCIEGSCQPWTGSSSRQPQVVSGQWSGWSDAMDSCQGSSCSSCQIKNQMSVRRVIRTCENPAPNNGGSKCEGNNYRAFVCNKQPCQYGLTANQYASQNCTFLRNKKLGDNIRTNGIGLQQDQDPCKIWCETTTSKDYYFTVSNFPDGTPCGHNKFCLAGHCLILACDSSHLVNTLAECPSPQKIPAKETRLEPPLGWSEWAPWMPCSTTCDWGTRTRTRYCKEPKDTGPSAGQCAGSSRDTERCRVNEQCSTMTASQKSAKSMPVLPTRGGASNETNSFEWSAWSACSAKCGRGVQTRSIRCSKCPWPVNDSRPCHSGPCHS